MDLDTAKIIASFMAPLTGTGIGVWLGVKGAINGMRADVKEMRSALVEVRDYARDTHGTIKEYVAEGRAAMKKIDRLDAELSD